MQDVQNSNYYSLSFDESFNRLTQSSEMDLIVSYLYHSDYLVKTRYASWVMLDIMICIKTSSPLLKGWMKGNYWKCRFKVFFNIQELLDIGTCGLHTIHGGLKTGTEASGWEMKAAYTILHDSPARRDNYQSVTGSSRAPWQSVQQDGSWINLWPINSCTYGQIVKN